MLLKFIESIVREIDVAHRHSAIRCDVEADDSAECSDVMVLLADGVPRKVHLDMTGPFGKLHGRHLLALQLMQSGQQRHQVRAGRAETRSR